MWKTLVDIILSVFVVFGIYSVFVGAAREICSNRGRDIAVAVFDNGKDDLESKIYFAKKYYGLRTVIILYDESKKENIMNNHPNTEILTVNKTR